MKIIEALKELKLIIKKIWAAQEWIGKLNCLLSNEKPMVGSSDKDQAKEVHSLVQSIFDLEKNYVKLKGSIESTNNNTKVSIEWEERTITEWLTTLRNTYSIVKQTANYLNTNRAQKLLQSMPNKEWVEIIPCYDYVKMTDVFGKYMNKVEKISSTLEVINATTELI